MNTVSFNQRTYQVDFAGFLVESQEWDENFARGMAADVKIEGDLTDKHWGIIHWIRSYYKECGRCPLIYETCRAHNLRLKELKELFPTGYQRGACKLAGLTYREGFLGYSEMPESAHPLPHMEPDKAYSVDARGFLIEPAAWDEQFAIFKAHELGMLSGLSQQHWQVILFLRNQHNEKGEIPTVYDTCEAVNMEVDAMEKLFPNGYHRGAVKIAGLRLR